MKRRTFVVGIGVFALLAAVGLAACSDEEPMHEDVSATQTQVAFATAHPPTVAPTAGPSPTPTLTPTPYLRPTASPDLDLSEVITEVKSQAITLGDFQKRVRFERWNPLYKLRHIVERRGVEDVLDLTKPANSWVASVFVTLNDSNSLGVQVQRVMAIEAIATFEASRSKLISGVDENLFKRKQAEYLGLSVGEGGQLPPGFDALYAEFLDEMAAYTGMNEEDFLDIVRAQTLYTQLQSVIEQSPEAVAGLQDQEPDREISDLVLPSETQAAAAKARLEAGESLLDVAASLGFTPTGTDTSTVVTRDAGWASEEMINAIFGAAPNEVVGPFRMPDGSGWWIAVVQRDVTFDMINPADLDEIRQQYFLSWIEGRLDDPDYVEDHENWMEHIPQDPLPRDVSPLFVEENVIQPEGTTDPLFPNTED